MDVKIDILMRFCEILWEIPRDHQKSPPDFFPYSSSSSYASWEILVYFYEIMFG